MDWHWEGQRCLHMPYLNAWFSVSQAPAHSADSRQAGTALLLTQSLRPKLWLLAHVETQACLVNVRLDTKFRLKNTPVERFLLTQSLFTQNITKERMGGKITVFCSSLRQHGKALAAHSLVFQHTCHWYCSRRWHNGLRRKVLAPNKC